MYQQDGGDSSQNDYRNKLNIYLLLYDYLLHFMFQFEILNLVETILSAYPHTLPAMLNCVNNRAEKSERSIKWSNLPLFGLLSCLCGLHQYQVGSHH